LNQLWKRVYIEDMLGIIMPAKPISFSWTITEGTILAVEDMREYPEAGAP
jgi:hypothetical protein